SDRVADGLLCVVSAQRHLRAKLRYGKRSRPIYGGGYGNRLRHRIRLRAGHLPRLVIRFIPVPYTEPGIPYPTNIASTAAMRSGIRKLPDDLRIHARVR